jgi:hypothetical protein
MAEHLGDPARVGPADAADNSVPGRARSHGYCRTMGLFKKKKRQPDRPAEMTSADLSPQPPSSEEQFPPASDPVKQLERLEGMRDRGMLSQEEFDLEKRKVLASQSYRRI